MSCAVPFIQRSFECGCESWQCKGDSVAIYMRFWLSYDNIMLYERSMMWSDAILAFTFCSRVLFVLNMAEKPSKVGITAGSCN